MPTKKKTTGTPFAQFRSGDLQADLEARQTGDEGLGLVAKRDLERYYSLLQRELRTAREALTENEMLALCNLANGTLWDATSAPLLWAETADAHPATLEKWNVDQEALVAKLRTLSPITLVAIVDAIEQWWLLEAGDNHENLKRVGLQ